MQDRRDAEGWEGEGEEEEVFGVAPLHVCVFVPEQWGEVSAVTKKKLVTTFFSVTSDAVQLWKCDCSRYCAFYR